MAVTLFVQAEVINQLAQLASHFVVLEGSVKVFFDRMIAHVFVEASSIFAPFVFL